MDGRLILGKRVRHLKRYREIARVLIRNGFGWFIDEIGLTQLLTMPRRFFGDANIPETVSMYVRARRSLEQLGPTFIKFGQVASLRPDIFPAELVEELSKLQDEVPPMAAEEVRQIVESELGTKLDEWFRSFNFVPIGSASIGQVHQAKLITGEIVAVKVQRADIRRQIEVDFEILGDIARLAQRHFEWARHYDVVDVIAEFERTLLNELDYRLEGRNAERIKDILAGLRDVYVPDIFWDLTTQKVLVMEYVEGIKLTNRDTLVAAGHNPTAIAETVSRAVFTQLLLHGFFHADPHPGNLAVLDEGVVLFMDFGMVGRLTDEMKERLSYLIIGLMRKNTGQVIRSLHRMGVVPADVDELALQRDVDLLREKYYDIPLSQISLGESIQDIFNVAYRHRIKIPSDLSLVGKTLVTVEGVVEMLDPDFRIMDVAEPFGRELLKERLDPSRLARNLLGSAVDIAEFALDLPRHVKILFREFRQGKVRVQLDVPELSTLLSKLDRTSNRLSFSVILLSLSIFMAGLMIASTLAKSAKVIWNFPLTDVMLAMGAVMLILLIWAIVKSGRM